MNKQKIKVEEPKVKDTTDKTISTRKIIPSGRQFNEVDKKHWVDKLGNQKIIEKDKKNVDTVNKK
jgi:hypothetical protein